MHNIRHAVAASFVLAAIGCGSSEESTLLGEAATAGSGAKGHERWRGLQICKGTAGGAEVLSSDETQIDDYTASKTRVQLSGVRVGPPDYSCGPLDFDAVVTSTTVGTYFKNPMTRSCTSPSGQVLEVSTLDGYDLDQRAVGSSNGNWNLNFDLRIESQAVDAGSVAEQVRTDITCNFELTLR